MSSTKKISILIFAIILTINTGCNQASQVAPKNDPIVKPDNFDESVIIILACPENLSALRLARQSELASINDRIKNASLKHWDASLVSEPVQAALIREDGKIAYKIDNGIPVMLIEQALVLDDGVGPPQPDKHRR